MVVQDLVKTSLGEDGAIAKDFLGEVDALMVNVPPPMKFVNYENDHTGVREDGGFVFDDFYQLESFKQCVSFFILPNNKHCALIREQMPDQMRKFTRALKYFSKCREITPLFHERLAEFIDGLKSFTRPAIEDYNHPFLCDLLRSGSLVVDMLDHNSLKVRIPERGGVLRGFHVNVKGSAELRAVVSNCMFEAFMKLGHSFTDALTLDPDMHDAVYVSDKVGVRELCLLSCLRKRSGRVFEQNKVPVLLRSQPGWASSAEYQRKYFASLLFMLATDDRGKLSHLEFLERETLAKFLLSYDGLDDAEHKVRMMLDHKGYMRMYLIDKEVLTPTNANRVAGAPEDRRIPTAKLDENGYLNKSACGNCEEALGCGDPKCIKLAAGAIPTGLQIPLFRLWPESDEEWDRLVHRAQLKALTRKSEPMERSKGISSSVAFCGYKHYPSIYDATQVTGDVDASSDVESDEEPDTDRDADDQDQQEGGGSLVGEVRGGEGGGEGGGREGEKEDGDGSGGGGGDGGGGGGAGGGGGGDGGGGGGDGGGGGGDGGGGGGDGGGGGGDGGGDGGDDSSSESEDEEEEEEEGGGGVDDGNEGEEEEEDSDSDGEDGRVRGVLRMEVRPTGGDGGEASGEEDGGQASGGVGGQAGVVVGDGGCGGGGEAGVVPANWVGDGGGGSKWWLDLKVSLNPEHNGKVIGVRIGNAEVQCTMARKGAIRLSEYEAKFTDTRKKAYVDKYLMLGYAFELKEGTDVFKARLRLWKAFRHAWNQGIRMREDSERMVVLATNQAEQMESEKRRLILIQEEEKRAAREAREAREALKKGTSMGGGGGGKKGKARESGEGGKARESGEGKARESGEGGQAGVVVGDGGCGGGGEAGGQGGVPANYVGDGTDGEKWWLDKVEGNGYLCNGVMVGRNRVLCNFNSRGVLRLDGGEILAKDWLKRSEVAEYLEKGRKYQNKVGTKLFSERLRLHKAFSRAWNQGMKMIHESEVMQEQIEIETRKSEEAQREEKAARGIAKARKASEREALKKGTSMGGGGDGNKGKPRESSGEGGNKGKARESGEGGEGGKARESSGEGGNKGNLKERLAHLLEVVRDAAARGGEVPESVWHEIWAVRQQMFRSGVPSSSQGGVGGGGKASSKVGLGGVVVEKAGSGGEGGGKGGASKAEKKKKRKEIEEEDAEDARKGVGRKRSRDEDEEWEGSSSDGGGGGKDRRKRASVMPVMPAMAARRGYNFAGTAGGMEALDSRARTAEEAFALINLPGPEELRAQQLAGELRVGRRVTVLIESRGRFWVKDGVYPAIMGKVNKKLGLFLPRFLGNLRDLNADDWFSVFHYGTQFGPGREWIDGWDMRNVEDDDTLALYEANKLLNY